MAHEVLFSNSYNGYIRQLRSFTTNAPRVNRANDHDDINNLGVDYTLGITGARPAGDILHVASEIGCPLTTHRATVVVPTAIGGAYQTNINDTVTWNSAARTITSDGSTDFTAAGVIAGDLIRVSNAATASNDKVFRVLTITGGSNHILTMNTLDSITNNDAADVIDIRPITGGTVFDVREDQPSGNTFIGWMMDEVEFMANDGSIWLFMRSGGSWAISDFAEWTMEGGHFTLLDERTVTRLVDLNENGAGADTITRSDYNGNFIRDGFVALGRVVVTGTTEDGTYTIVSVTAKTITLNIGDFTASDLAATATLKPVFEVSVDFATPANTITRTVGSWISDGYEAGGNITITDAVDGGNNSTFLVDTVTALVLTVDVGETIAAEIGDTITHLPNNGPLQVWTEHRYRWSNTSGSTGPVGQSLDSGELPPIPDANGNYTSEWVGIAPGDDVNNNPQAIYLGWQSQFTGSSKQNVEMRAFDAVSDSEFGALGNASPPTYIYLTLTPSAETYMTADGAHVTGFLDVNTSVTEWFYLGYGNIHGSANQHPRPVYCGGTGWESGGTRASSGDRYRFFQKGADFTGITGSLPKASSCCWMRWVDGTWYSVGTYHQNNSATVLNSSNLNVEMINWPYYSEGPINFLHNDDQSTFTGVEGTGNDNPSESSAFIRGLQATPPAITPLPNREYPLIPVVTYMVNPNNNIVSDFRNIYFIPGDGQATKNRVLQGGFTYIVGQNHDRTGQQDFSALRLA